jgi:DNA-binding NarL/FixJ family response regulator
MPEQQLRRQGDPLLGRMRGVEGILGVASILICDERRSIRQRLSDLLSAVPGLTPINTVASGAELLERYPHEHPDVVIVGTQRAVDSGILTIRELLSDHAGVPVLVFGAADDQRTLAAAMSCGARGYLSWDSSPLELRAALAHLLADDDLPRDRAATADGRSFTDRELQVLHGMSQGKSNSEIGRALFLSEETVKAHARRLFRKLGVEHRAQAVAYGFRCGLVR